MRSDHTGADGSYSVGGLSTGEYIARTQLTGYVEEYYQNRTSWDTATPIFVSQPYDTSGIDFSLQVLGEIASGLVEPEAAKDITAVTDVITTLSFPAGAVTEPVTVTIGITNSQTVPSGFLFLGNNFTISASTNDGTPVSTFLQPFTITIAYDDADVEDMDEASLELFYWDANSQFWVEILTEIDMDANILTAYLDHLSTFAVLGPEIIFLYIPVIFK